jgi:hypothetical protein
MLVVAIALALAGCGLPNLGHSTKPPSAATILEDAALAQKTQVKDVEFSMTMAISTSGITGTGTTDISGNFTGTLTTSPEREDVMTNMTAAGIQFSGEIIVDVATSTLYIKFSSTSLPGLPAGTWTKVTTGSSLDPLTVDPSQLSDLSQFKGATLKGPETLDGIQVWHLQANSTTGGLTSQADIYIRQDNHQLYELIAHINGALTGIGTPTTGTPTTGTITYKVTGENTGKTISLPPASEVSTVTP